MKVVDILQQLNDQDEETKLENEIEAVTRLEKYAIGG